MSGSNDLSDFSLLDLFRAEVETQAASMTAGLLALERDPSTTQPFDAVMRGAHSLKGAAAIVNRRSAVRVAHAMEDCILAAKGERAGLLPHRIDELLRGVDLLKRIAEVPEADVSSWDATHRREINAFLDALAKPGIPAAGTPAPAMAEAPPPPAPQHIPPEAPRPPAAPRQGATWETSADGRGLQVGAENLNLLLGIAGEGVVASRWLKGFTARMSRFKRLQQELTKSLALMRESLAEVEPGVAAKGRLTECENMATVCRDALAARLEELDDFDRRFINLSGRLYEQVLDCRMRPFGNVAHSFSRLVRDVARALGKQVKLEVAGESTPVDREILQRIEAPLTHLLRNAVDHGCESPEERLRTGKPAEGTVRLAARHRSGTLLIEVAEDGRGIDLEALRSAVLRKGLAPPEVAEKLTDAELLEFLYLPGFTLKDAVTEISGRGVGLDVVQSMVKEVGGTVRISSQLGRGTQFQLQLPLTLSVVRTLLVEIGGEPYAFPLGQITRAVKVAREKVESIEGREHFTFEEQQIGLVTAHQVLGLEGQQPENGMLSVVVIGGKVARYGLIIDRFLGERELVVRPLDARLGKVKDISAAALMPDQSPALIIDVDDLLRSIENLVTGGRLTHLSRGAESAATTKRKRVLVVDDSLTVRELERKLIAGRGYHVEVAVDGMDAWNAMRTGAFDLVVTDVDMPRLDGIELVSLIKQHARLQSVPVMIVSYKDREEDRRRGLEAGANYYLTKGSFQDETLLQAVVDLIGEAEE
jgi:two-component system sensor histidine kinase and response regulator WspE